MTHAQKVEQQRKRWMETPLRRMNHAYSILMARVSKRGNWRRTMPRIRHLEAHIREAERQR